MTSAPDGETAARAAGQPPSATLPLTFTGASADYRSLMVNGAVFLFFTLGLYRFWLTTDMRAFLWSNTRIGEEPLDYTGRPVELLVGFLIAIAILIPINAAFFVATLGLGPLGELASASGFVALIVLGHFAVYRARRYRLTRTVFRGVRLHQDGSALGYAARAIVWWGLTIATAGLFYPFMRGALERYKFRHTFYGDLPGKFAGSGFRLLFRGFLLWFAVVAPLAGGIAALILAIDWNVIGDISDLDPDGLVNRFAEAGAGGAIVLAGVGATVSVLAAALLYPAFQMMVLRWWLGGIRFGDVAVTTTLRTAQMYGIYLRFTGWAILLVIALVVLAIGGAAALGYATPHIPAEIADIATPAAALAFYVVAALAFSTLYQVVVRLGQWRIAVNATALAGYLAIERVRATGAPSSAVGEGLADALGAGGW